MSRSPLNELKKTNDVIERYLSSLGPRGAVAQDILAHLRHLTEHLAMTLVHGRLFSGSDYYEAIQSAMSEMSRRRGSKFLWEFHKLLQKSVSHYSLSQDDAQRLLLKYREYLVLCKELAFNELGVRILVGLDNIDWDEDPGLRKYYELVYDKVSVSGMGVSSAIGGDRFYIYSRKPVFAKSQLFYEYSLVPAMDFTSKFDHAVAFSKERIPTNYSISISVKHASVPALGGTMIIMIIDGWRVSMRPCEINKLLKIVGSSETISGHLKSYKSLMNFLTETKMSLVDLCLRPSAEFDRFVNSIAVSGRKTGIQELLLRSRSFLLSRKPGSNVLRYLLYRTRHQIVRSQLCGFANRHLSGLYLQNGCIPFDMQPFCTSLIGHSPALHDLILCIDPTDYEDNMLVRAVSKKEESSGHVFINQKEFDSFKDVDALVSLFNQNLYSGHEGRKVIHEMGQLFVKEAESDLVYIVKELQKHSKLGIGGYRASTEAKLHAMTPKLDDQQKIEIASTMYEASKVAMLYGSAGTGKTTLVNIICGVFSNARKIAIANTNPAVDNLRRRIKDSNCDFMTISRYLRNGPNDECDLLIVDECSTVSNADMRKVLSRGGFRLLLLVGDTCQIQSIRLGNWFDVARDFLDDHCVFQLETSWRAANNSIKELWDSVRNMKGDIAERFVSCSVSKPLCEDIFNAKSKDEIILCLNYDGLYGINSINRMLQTANRGKTVKWGLHTFKVGDPVLFNESGRFAPVLYNNLKGTISDLNLDNTDLLRVEIVVDTPLNSFEVLAVPGLRYIANSFDGTTTVGFDITKHNEDDDGESSSSSVIPFQVAYAVSIHKAQGLEYDSVKIIVTKDVENKVSHSIFYTAITRAKNHLTIYWSPETQKKVIEAFSGVDNGKDAQLMATRNGLSLRCRGSRKSA